MSNTNRQDHLDIVLVYNLGGKNQKLKLFFWEIQKQKIVKHLKPHSRIFFYNRDIEFCGIEMEQVTSNLLLTALGKIC